MNCFSIVVPLIPQHDSKIRHLFRSLAKENYLIREIILARSESFAPKWLLEAKFRLIAKTIGLNANIIVDSVRGIARDGTNRNRGWAIATAPYVAFLDADDHYVDNRLEVIYAIFSEHTPDAVIHNYVSFDEEVQDLRFSSGKSVATKNCQLAKSKLEGEEFFAVCDEDFIRLQIHFAHLTLKTNIRDSMKFSDRFPAADAQMTQDLLLNGKKVLYTDQKLSSWVRDRSARYKFRLIRRRLSSLFTT